MVDLVDDCIFNNDIRYMKSLIGRDVSIETVNGVTHTGTVYVIDPVYKTVVLASDQHNGNYELLMHHAIKSLVTTTDHVNEKFVKGDIRKFSNEECERATATKAKLLRLFQEKSIRVVEEKGGRLVVEEHVKIEPPYGLEQCYCSNTIVLERIRDLYKHLED